MKRIRRILYATDFSPPSRRAFTTALALAEAMDAKLTVVHVMAPLVPTVPDQYFDAVIIMQLEKQARDWSARQLKTLAGRARRADISVRTLLVAGDATSRIVGTARSLGADLIVVGTHGRRGLPKLLLGSVAERVVGMAPCPVVTVRGK